MTINSKKVNLNQELNLPAKTKSPNAATLKAIREIKTEGGKHFANVDELFASWDNNNPQNGRRQ
ncbi:MAG: hypothetical protein WCL30_00110 [Pseudomonadota bacterium]